jgi:hypothetical protein
VIKRAPATSASAITFILKLLNMLVSKAIPVSLRAPKAATTSISQERQAHRLAGPDAAEVGIAVAISAGLETVLNSPARPQVILIPWPGSNPRAAAFIVGWSAFIALSALPT